MKDVFRFISEVRLELSRVIWPKPEELFGSTVVVIVFTTIMAVYLWQLDFWFNRGLGYLLKLFSA